MDPIIPIVRKDPFDRPGWIYELKYNGFRGLADTDRGRMLSKNRNHMKRFDALLAGLPAGCVFDGEIVVLDREGRPQFNALVWGQSVAVTWPIRRGPRTKVVCSAMCAPFSG
jgi:bifunctional non-homologous end joining protein LigD